jgi:Arc/MetJ-type ribon-helix-helix transcriptional regulator
VEPRVTIKIPAELYRRLRRMTEGTGFSSVTEFIVFVMRSVASTGDLKQDDQLTADEVRAIRERLKRLGYIKEGE